MRQQQSLFLHEATVFEQHGRSISNIFSYTGYSGFNSYWNINFTSAVCVTMILVRTMQPTNTILQYMFGKSIANEMCVSFTVQHNY